MFSAAKFFSIKVYATSIVSGGQVRFGLYVKLSNSNSTSHINLFLSHSTGGLYVQSRDSINSQDNSTETEIQAGVQVTYRNKMRSTIMHNVIHDYISIVSGLLHMHYSCSSGVDHTVNLTHQILGECRAFWGLPGKVMYCMAMLQMMQGMYSLSNTTNLNCLRKVSLLPAGLYMILPTHLWVRELWPQICSLLQALD